MAKELFLPLFLDFNEMTQELSDEECGRLVRALVQYARGEEYEDRLGNGQDRLAFRFMKGTLDRNTALSSKRAEAGAKGGKQTQASNKQSSSNAQAKHEQTESKTPITNNNNNNETNTNNKSSSSLPPSSFMDDDEAHRIQVDHDKVLDAAQNAGIALNRIVTARLIDLYGEYGLEKMLGAIDACARYAAPNLAYLEAVLKGSPKKAKPKVNAQDYDQRSYEEVSDEIMADQIREMEEWLKKSG